MVVKCETCQDTQWSCIVETDDGDFIEDTCPDCQYQDEPNQQGGDE